MFVEQRLWVNWSDRAGSSEANDRRPFRWKRHCVSGEQYQIAGEEYGCWSEQFRPPQARRAQMAPRERGAGRVGTGFLLSSHASEVSLVYAAVSTSRNKLHQTHTAV